MEKTEPINVFDAAKCREIYMHQHRSQMFLSKENICAGKKNLENIKIVSVFCIFFPLLLLIYKRLQVNYVFNLFRKQMVRP